MKLFIFCLSTLSKRNVLMVNIFAVGFILVNAFLSLRDAESRKGTMCLFCVPIHKKRSQNTQVVPMKALDGAKYTWQTKMLSILMEVF